MPDLQSIRYGLRGSVTRWFERPAVSILVGLKFTPSVATAVGLGIAFIAAYFVYQGEFFIGGVLVLFSSVFDLLDGGIARATGRVSRRGALMGSVFDRVLTSTATSIDITAADANILVLPGRFINTSEAKKSVQAFLSTKFESGRHKRRIKKL